ncbi:MAG: sensor histidine kinase, partial [Verrucomicrobiota bacterium]
ALAWIGLLRRQVARRGALLAQEIAARSEAVIEFDTTLRERTRLANDLHDTVEQALTGLSLQIQAAELFHDSEPARSVQHLRLAQQFLDRSRDDVHRTVWDLRAQGLDGRSLTEALQEQANAIFGGGPVRIEVTSDGVEFPLPDLIAGNLLLLAQEAITNAMKHAKPGKLAVLVTFNPNGVTLLVTDDGAGFDPERVPGHREGHFGLQGMRERVKRLGGSLRIVSTPGHGSRIEVVVPKLAFGVAATAL